MIKKIKIRDGKISAADLQITSSEVIPDKAVLRGVRVSYIQDENKKKTDQIEAVRYDCINETDFSSFTIKVPSSLPVITNEELESAEGIVHILIPVGETHIKPYKIEYGQVFVSIVAPYVSLVKQN